VAIGVIVRIRAFAHGRSLWVDESSLAISFLDRSFFGLLLIPLDYGQSAPPGFIGTTHLITSALGFNQFTLRLIPLLASIAGVVLVYLISVRHLKSYLARAFFIGVFSVSPVLIYYSAEFKQYSVDVLAVLFFTYLLSVNYKNKSMIWNALLLLLTAWLLSSSLIAIPVLALFLVVRFVTEQKDHSCTSVWHFVVENRLLLGVSSGFILLHAFHIFINRKVASNMTNYWTAVGAFPPIRIESVDDFLWLPLRIANMVSDGFISQQVSTPGNLVYSPGAWVPVITLIAIALIVSRSKQMLFVLSVIVLPVILSFSYIYPLGGRLTLFTIPAVFFSVAKGIDIIADSTDKFRLITALLLASHLALNPLSISAGQALSPNDKSDTIWALGAIEENNVHQGVLLYDGHNQRQIRVHKAMGYGELVSTDFVSIELSDPNSDWQSPSQFVWLLSTRRISDMQEIKTNLQARGFSERCSYQDQGMLLTFLVHETVNDNINCELLKD